MANITTANIGDFVKNDNDTGEIPFKDITTTYQTRAWNLEKDVSKYIRITSQLTTITLPICWVLNNPHVALTEIGNETAQAITTYSWYPSLGDSVGTMRIIENNNILAFIYDKATITKFEIREI